MLSRREGSQFRNLTNVLRRPNCGRLATIMGAHETSDPTSLRAYCTKNTNDLCAGQARAPYHVSFARGWTSSMGTSLKPASRDRCGFSRDLGALPAHAHTSTIAPDGDAGSASARDGRVLWTLALRRASSERCLTNDRWPTRTQTDLRGTSLQCLTGHSCRSVLCATPRSPSLSPGFSFVRSGRTPGGPADLKLRLRLVSDGRPQRFAPMGPAICRAPRSRGPGLRRFASPDRPGPSPPASRRSGPKGARQARCARGICVPVLSSNDPGEARGPD